MGKPMKIDHQSFSGLIRYKYSRGAQLPAHGPKVASRATGWIWPMDGPGPSHVAYQVKWLSATKLEKNTQHHKGADPLNARSLTFPQGASSEGAPVLW